MALKNAAAVSLRARSSRRVLQVIDLVLYVSGIVVLAAVINFFATQDGFRRQIDATKTRAYSLSDQTQRLLATLPGDWTIALVMVEDDTDRVTGRQVNEVLERFSESAPGITVARIDPTNPRSLREFETLLGDLRSLYGDLVTEYEMGLDEGLEAFESLRLFALQESAKLETFVGQLPGDTADSESLGRWVKLLALVAHQGQAVTDEVLKARKVDESRPLPDYETARSILAETLSQWAQELYDLSQVFDRWFDEPTLTEELRRFAAAEGRALEREAEGLAVAADPLRRLPPLELSEIARQIQKGEVAIIVGNNRAAAIPSAQLFPKTNLRSASSGAVTFDQRFRGEQLIASAIRSLIVEQMPTVVFVHAEDRSLLRSHDRDVDLVGVSEMLKASRFGVREWIVHKTERPPLDPEQPVVWVAVPPTKRGGLEPGEGEQMLTRAIGQLIVEGESLLLSVHPSIWGRYRRDDPWIPLAGAFGLEPDTSNVVYESVRVSDDDVQIERGQVIQHYPDGGLITEALEGQPSYFAVPVPIRMKDTTTRVERQVIAEIDAGTTRWLESEWDVPLDREVTPPEADRLQAPVPIAATAEKTHPARERPQRCVLIGSGGWMLSYIADVAVNIGGDRVALMYPGNHELMLASVAWLAGMDDLIAASPASREVGRMHGVSDGTRRRWSFVSIGLLPGAWMALGLLVWWWRR